jgi:hypothetical protein
MTSYMMVYKAVIYMTRICDLYSAATSLSPSLSLSLDVQPFGSWQLFQFLNLYTIGRAPWTGDQPTARPLPTHRITQI